MVRQSNLTLVQYLIASRYDEITLLIGAESIHCDAEFQGNSGLDRRHLARPLGGHRLLVLFCRSEMNGVSAFHNSVVRWVTHMTKNE